MVRTYAYNPSIENSSFSPYFGNSSVRSVSLSQQHQQHIETKLSETPIVQIESHEERHHQPQQHSTVPSHYHMPLHSPHIDPIGSIISLRVLYLEGRLCYVPVEPHLQCVINQQFGENHAYKYPSSSSSVHLTAPQSQNLHNKEAVAFQKRSTYIQFFLDDTPPWLVSHPQPKSGIRKSRLWMGEYNSTSENNLSHSNTAERPLISFDDSAIKPDMHKKTLSEKEQHKLDLLKQIEENKLRRQMEIELERKQEERDIKKLEEYNEKIRKEEENEKKRQREKMKLVERQNEEVLKSSKTQTMDHHRRSISSPNQKEKSYRERTNQSSNRDEQQLEWWEKKPCWEGTLGEDRSNTVIPAIPTISEMRRKSDINMSRRRTNNYNPADSVETHQSEGSRTSQDSQRNKKKCRTRSTSTASEKQISPGSSRNSVHQQIQVLKTSVLCIVHRRLYFNTAADVFNSINSQ
ncbi:hypothetical protein DICVIV_10750 [Dictyocaulus viviparus]|uniref:CCDC66 domain-containing protein n=1 Tax=Dictyocaulus viviparus TaxID=29172 RepID=A0A0D8XHL6_DICVI|nr:hypothetical protein DICVIV_10750 [Dictyocaulus viviparus]